MAEQVQKKANLGKWFRELRSEAKKVVWPSLKSTVSNTWIVIGMIVVVGVLIAAFDAIARFALVDGLMKLLGK